MITIEHKENCSGCAACKQACPKACITMVPDKEGFMYPHVNMNSCVNCNKCNKVCQYDNRYSERTCPDEGYAFINGDTLIRESSSSGGFFYAIAVKILDEGGVVFGAVFDKDFQTEITYVSEKGQLEPLLRSKYVQARVGNAYADAKKFLLEGKKVLFCGTPCQINGLCHYLGKEYENLLCVDFACHSIPSPLIWEEYLTRIKGTSDIKSINFKDKSFGWNNYGLTVKSQEDEVLVSQGNKNNLYMKGFLADLYSRPSCTNCVSRNFSSGSDITIADFWGIEKYHQDDMFIDNKGVSLIIPLSYKGRDLIIELKDNNILHSVNSREFELTSSHGCLARSSGYHRFRKLFWLLNTIVDVRIAIWICVEPLAAIKRIFKRI